MEGGSSISKVSVEYHDPSGLYPLIAKQLAANLPLRDLNWKSATRPLRSINSLHIDLVAAQDDDRPGSRHAAGGAEHSSPARTPGERRHQIPGLRQTPYLKVLLLRCDDSETYKSTARKTVREWLKAHTPASQSSSTRSSQENHDAFEWLILHVVLPNTQAASQPRISTSSSKSETATNEKSGSSSKLLGRSSSTILEKLKADFNVSSKSALDRVEQVRLRAEELPANLIPARPPSGVGDWTDSPQDLALAWQDLINKLKTLILSSFSLRVSQYEDDIRERDSQRSLPGWNFCTFFMLKEGLLRGFESVGLVDDALIGYDELSLGLDSLMSEVNDDGTTTRSDSFLKYTKEMKDILLQCLTSESGPDIVWKSGTKFISTARKDYRNLIVNSNVSRFDFQSYVFARQVAILLRMSTPDASMASRQSEAQAQVKSPQELAALSELCQRALGFLTAASRTLKTELLEAATAQGVQSPISIIDNIVASFTFAVADQILETTKVAELANIASTPRQRHDLDRVQHPERRSSLPVQPEPAPKPEDPMAMLRQLELRSAMYRHPEEEFYSIQVSELESLAGHRADLLLLQRQLAEKIAAKQGWTAGVARLRGDIAEDQVSYADVDLNGEESGKKPAEDMPHEAGVHGVLHSSLLHGLSSPEDYSKWFESLSTLLLTQCVTAVRLRTAERLCADLAVLRFDAGDYAIALNYLSKVVPLFANQDWQDIEQGLSDIHLKCLKKLNRKDDYVRMAMSMLSKAAARKRLVNFRSGFESRPDAEHELSSHLLQDAAEVSASLPCDVIVSINDFFTGVSINPYIEHFVDKDGFSVTLSLRSLLAEELNIDSVQMKIKCTEPPFRDLWLESDGPLLLTPGTNHIRLETHTTCYGLFTVEKIIATSKKISFEAENRQSSSLGLSGQMQAGSKTDGSIVARLPHILSYASETSLNVEVSTSRVIYINKTRLLQITLHTGKNAIQKGQLSLRAASAGLRLMMADAIWANSETRIQKGKEPGALELPELEESSTTTISLPYDLESSLPQITISLDVRYSTANGDFHYMANPSVVVDLALDVSVHDLIKEEGLFSRFQIRASKGVPLHITSVELEESDRYSVEAPPCDLTPMLVLPEQDGTLLYKITPKTGADVDRPAAKDEKSLRLSVEYQLVDEAILNAMRESLQQGLRDTTFAAIKPLLMQGPAEAFRKLDHEQLEEAALLYEFHLPEYEAMGWKELLSGVQPTLRQEIAAWLQRWHQDNQVLQLPGNGVGDNETQKRTHRLNIDVPLPRLQVLHIATLSVPKNSCIPQGGIVNATIAVHHTRRWETPSSTVPSGHGELRFALEVDASPDVWLLGGDRRTSFQAVEEEVKTFELLLVPLKTGRLLFPEVSVRWDGHGDEEVRCETDFRSAAETVFVVSGMKSATIGVHEMLPGAEVALIASEKRLQIS